MSGEQKKYTVDLSLSLRFAAAPPSVAIVGGGDTPRSPSILVGSFDRDGGVRGLEHASGAVVAVDGHVTASDAVWKSQSVVLRLVVQAYQPTRDRLAPAHEGPRSHGVATQKSVLQVSLRQPARVRDIQLSWGADRNSVLLVGAPTMSV